MLCLWLLSLSFLPAFTLEEKTCSETDINRIKYVLRDVSWRELNDQLGVGKEGDIHNVCKTDRFPASCSQKEVIRRFTHSQPTASCHDKVNVIATVLEKLRTPRSWEASELRSMFIKERTLYDTSEFTSESIVHSALPENGVTQFQTIENVNVSTFLSSQIWVFIVTIIVIVTSSFFLYLTKKQGATQATGVNQTAEQLPNTPTSISTQQYNAVLALSENIGRRIKTSKLIETLLVKFKAEKWIDNAATIDDFNEHSLVCVAVERIRQDSMQFPTFVNILRETQVMIDIADKLEGMESC